MIGRGKLDARLRSKLESMSLHERVEFTLAAARRCPSHGRCNAPRCSLDPLFHARSRYPGEEQGRAHKPTRLRIVAQCAAEGTETVDFLPYRGLTAKEAVGSKRGEQLRRQWAQMSEAQRAEALTRMARSRSGV